MKLIVSGSCDGGTETNDPNSPSEEDEEIASALETDVSTFSPNGIGDARGVGGLNSVANLSNMASSSNDRFLFNERAGSLDEGRGIREGIPDMAEGVCMVYGMNELCTGYKTLSSMLARFVCQDAKQRALGSTLR